MRADVDLPNPLHMLPGDANVAIAFSLLHSRFPVPPS